MVFCYLMIAINFIIRHEIAHIIHGHCGYLEHLFDKNGRFDENSDNGLEYLDRQTMEMDADSFAVNYAYKEIDFYIKNTPGKVIAIKDFLFAVYCFFRIFEFKHFDENTDRHNEHPPESIRMNMIISNILSILIKYNDPCLEEIKKELNNVLLSAEKAFTEISNDENSSKIFYMNAINSSNYVKEIINNWNKIYHVIKPFAIHPEFLPPLTS